MHDRCDAPERDQALVEQLRQQQLELAKAPVVETPPAIPQAPAEGTPTPAPASTPSGPTGDATLAPSHPDGTTAPAAEGEGGELPVGAGTGGGEAEVPETTTKTDEAAADGQPVALSVQDAAQEESRKRRESMRNNAEQVC